MAIDGIRASGPCHAAAFTRGGASNLQFVEGVGATVERSELTANRGWLPRDLACPTSVRLRTEWGTKKQGPPEIPNGDGRASPGPRVLDQVLSTRVGSPADTLCDIFNITCPKRTSYGFGPTPGQDRWKMVGPAGLEPATYRL